MSSDFAFEDQIITLNVNYKTIFFRMHRAPDAVGNAIGDSYPVRLAVAT